MLMRVVITAAFSEVGTLYFLEKQWLPQRLEGTGPIANLCTPVYSCFQDRLKTCYPVFAAKWHSLIVHHITQGFIMNSLNLPDGTSILSEGTLHSDGVALIPAPYLCSYSSLIFH